MKKKKNLQNNININKVSIYDCFEYFQQEKVLTEKDRIYCHNCKQKSNSNFSKKILTWPNVLILIINKGKDNIYDVKLKIEQTILITILNFIVIILFIY